MLSILKAMKTFKFHTQVFSTHTQELNMVFLHVKQRAYQWYSQRLAVSKERDESILFKVLPLLYILMLHTHTKE